MNTPAPTGTTFRSLSEPNVRIYLASFIASGVGTWAQTTALVLVVQSLGGNGLELGLITAFQFLPMLLMGLWAGSIADQVNRYRLTIFLQGALAAQALLLAILVFAGLHSIPALYALTALGGVFSAFDNPTRRTFLTELAKPEDLANVTSLSTSAMTGWHDRAVDRSHALRHRRCGLGVLLNGVSFLIMLVGLLRMDPTRFRLIAKAPKSKTPIRDGLRAVWGDPLLRTIMIVFSVVSTFGFNTLVSLPLVAKELLDRGPQYFGYLLSAQSVGNISGSLFVARKVDVAPALTFGAGGAIAVTLILGGLSTSLIATMLIMVGLGFASTMFVNSNTVLLQQRSSEQMRSRVLALSGVLFLGSTPIGGPITGLVGDHFGAGWSMAYGGVISGAAVLVGAAIHFRRAATDAPPAS
ncbi:MAG: MFS transporter [Acidimicrobiales bacterium]